MDSGSFTLGELADHLQLEYRGDRNLRITGLATLSQARSDQLTFLANPKYRQYLADTQAGAVILAPELVDECPVAALITSNPYLAYARVSHLFDGAPRVAPGIASSAVVAPDARLGADVAIGPGTVIGAGVELGAGTTVGANCVVGDGARIGAHCRLHPSVTIAHGVCIGDRTVIHSGAVIGADGFGFAPGPAGWEKIAQIGSVRIGSNVEIGANTTIDRGALGDTVIGDGVIIDNLVMIAHNCEIGDGTAIAGCVGIAGSVKVGKRCTLAGGVGLNGHITLTDGVHVTGMSLVTRSIDKPGSYSSGTGTMDTSAWRKSAVRFSQLDELARRVAELERQLHSVKDKG
ncbi:MAG: UDP-3-O-(3-hydroxymyristoyl)glucosamine N-acyltransferase [Spongiibacteraceae bacterium]|jgi:UDP-3-O-[3-hydroxymyristoyl] glucosamine N-acyltransferase|nr:UDP-3-O-(3-hydroxymyristoyl)glucosamine N-acyltransferase [Spongiibacteraceae bacterium]